MHTHRETESDPTVLVEISRKKLDIKDKNKVSNVLKVFYVPGNGLNVLYLLIFCSVLAFWDEVSHFPDDKTEAWRS